MMFVLNAANAAAMICFYKLDIFIFSELMH
jgi:hypothetical protein